MSSIHNLPGYAVWLVCLLWIPWTAAAPLHHDLNVVLHPDTHSIEIRDTITLTGGATDALIVALHPELLPVLLSPGAHLTALPALNSSADQPGIVPKRYRVQLAAGANSFTLRYKGNIRHALQQQGEEYARSFQQTPGIISPQRVFLASTSFWYPRIKQSIIKPETHSLVVLGRHPQKPDQALGWLTASSPAALPGLGRKLPHYGRYSYLAFTGTAPDNVLKGQWPVVNSPLSVAVVQDDGVKIEFSPARLAPRKALAPAAEPLL